MLCVWSFLTVVLPCSSLYMDDHHHQAPQLAQAKAGIAAHCYPGASRFSSPSRKLSRPQPTLMPCLTARHLTPTARLHHCMAVTRPETREQVTVRGPSQQTGRLMLSQCPAGPQAVQYQGRCLVNKLLIHSLHQAARRSQPCPEHLRQHSHKVHHQITLAFQQVKQ